MVPCKLVNATILTCEGQKIGGFSEKFRFSAFLLMTRANHHVKLASNKAVAPEEGIKTVQAELL